MFDLQVVNDVPGFLSRVRAHLRPDGLFIAVAIGGDSLTELRQAFLVADSEITGGAFARVAPFIPLADAGGGDGHASLLDRGRGGAAHIAVDLIGPGQLPHAR